MTKKSFPIPEGCKAVTVEQVGNQIITTFEPVFKRGDVIYCEDNDSSTWIFIFESEIVGGLNPYKYFCLLNKNNDIILNNSCRTPSKKIRHATTEEAQRLWDELAEEGKRWNPETMQVEEIKKERWRAEIKCKYWFVINGCLGVSSTVDARANIDNELYDSGNYFQTKEQAQRAADRLKSELDKFWEEELRF